ncbi:uncharacterized protein LOC144123555 [Amblyomma americanum]
MDKSWGYQTANPKGKTLTEAAENTDCNLLTDPDTPTRIGNSVSTDTCPDLTFIRGAEQAEWANLLENLGSDHCILKTQATSDRPKRQLGSAKIADWSAFREACDGNLAQNGIQSIEEWGNMLKEKQRKYTKEIARTTQTPETLIDPTKTKAENNKAIFRFIHQFEGPDSELLEKVRVKCFGDTNPAAYAERYRGREKYSLDRPITREEVYAAIQNTTRNTAAVADKINNALIRNLSDGLVAQLTDFLNKHWEAETVPEEWKHAEVVMIPKLRTSDRSRSHRAWENCTNEW